MSSSSFFNASTFGRNASVSFALTDQNQGNTNGANSNSSFQFGGGSNMNNAVGTNAGASNSFNFANASAIVPTGNNSFSAATNTNANSNTNNNSNNNAPPNLSFLSQNQNQNQSQNQGSVGISTMFNTNNNTNCNNNPLINNNNNANNTNNNTFTNMSHMMSGNVTNPIEQMRRIAEQYNPQSANCRFETVLYNRLPSDISSSCFNKPPLIRTQIWDQGVKNNPSPKQLIPVGVRGYSELNERGSLCLAGHCAAIKQFQQISEKVNSLKEEINIKTKQTIADLKQTQIHLSHRLLAILRSYINRITLQQQQQQQHYAVQHENMSYPSNLSMMNASTFNSSSLHPHSLMDITVSLNRNNGLTPKEMKLKHVLDQMMKESKQLINLYSHVNKLSSELGVDDTESRGALQTNSVLMSNNSANVLTQGINHIDPQNMKQLFGFLKQQQQFIGLLVKTVQKDAKDLNVISNGVQPKIQGSPQHSVY